jgi:phospholipid/cholesterol/gamma-HCH transport system substrate-binding protein
MPMTDQLRKLLGLPPGPSPAAAGAPVAPPTTGIPAATAGTGQPGGVQATDPTMGGILQGRS